MSRRLGYIWLEITESKSIKYSLFSTKSGVCDDINYDISDVSIIYEQWLYQDNLRIDSFCSVSIASDNTNQTILPQQPFD